MDGIGIWLVIGVVLVLALLRYARDGRGKGSDTTSADTYPYGADTGWNDHHRRRDGDGDDHDDGVTGMSGSDSGGDSGGDGGGDGGGD
ncbi:MAG TPA: hypothetical protein PLJ34_05085 [Hyphomicrobiales bacterium]|nr:hypothetical protein [Hyphomicrobiales bacterium]